ncbi:MAG: PA2779 family protein [Candidatus Omnitrophica bacterium]|nr:PA2779 family protein [Candidatus Omnitrophota bacterium]
MLRFIYKRKFIFLFFLAWAIFLGIKPNLGYAGLVNSKVVTEGERGLYLEKINSFLKDEKVMGYLNRFGMDRDALINKIEQLETDRLRDLALRCDKIKVGGDSGVFIVILIILLLIIIVLYVTNYTVKIEPRDAVPRRY